MPSFLFAQYDNKGLLPLCTIRMEGELRVRLDCNFQRLHEEKYQPQHVFLTDEESGFWPGDTEGRTLLALVMDAQALGQEPLYLKRIIQLLPQKLNAKGYMGTMYGDTISEQQLSGNGWLLRGLCEYYAWKGDRSVLPIIKSIASNLFVKAKGHYRHYPILPQQRKSNVGEASGTLQNVVDGWLLSSDIGCVFIGMEGLIHAYQYVGNKEMRSVIEEMIARFLEIDLVGIKAQTHASLTACRGLVRYGDLTGDRRYYDEAERRWLLYKQHGMTPNYENYNWFGRRATWTEPCAIVDSYMLALQLWQRTGKMEYRNDAELIYYNALCHTQRANGGFGCDTCPHDSQTMLGIHEPEAHWCCTMRGAEGLATAARYTYLLQGDTLLLPFFRTSQLMLCDDKEGILAIDQTTSYPFSGMVTLSIKENSMGIKAVKIPRLPWAEDVGFSLNGQTIIPDVTCDYYTITKTLQQGDTLDISFQQKYERKDRRFFYGPLLLGADSDTPSQLTPVYHLMDPKVWDNHYQKQILF